MKTENIYIVFSVLFLTSKRNVLSSPDPQQSYPQNAPNYYNQYYQNQQSPNQNYPQQQVTPNYPNPQVTPSYPNQNYPSPPATPNYPNQNYPNPQVTPNYPNQYFNNANPSYPSSTGSYDYGRNNPPPERYNQNSRYDPTSNQYYTPTSRYDPQNRQYPDRDSDRDGRNFGGVGYYPGRNPEPVDFIPPQEIEALLDRLDQLGSEQCSLNLYAQWDYETNVNDATQLNALAAQQQHAYFQKEVHDLLKQIEYRRVPDPRLWRQLRYLSVVGPAALPPEQYDRYNRLVSEMVAVYDQAAICAYNEPFRCGLRLNPDLNLIMARSRDWEELQHTWVEWRRHTGQYVRDLYDQLVDVTNQAARLNNFTTAADLWNFPYEAPTFQQDVEDVWLEVSPLFEHLHAYVRRKLRDLYGPERISRRAPLPSHILGNMWAQSWSNIIDITIPYPGKNFLDVSPNMVDQGYTPLTMLQLAEEFFLSLNMSAMPPEFWAGSIITNTPERILNCKASAWDFCNRRDYRLKMCAEVNMKDFISMHHEMAHLQYFLEYKLQPKVFRDGANPGFHEAVGEAVALSVGNPTHFQTLGLVQTSIDEFALDINYLFSIAMDKLPFLPFALVMDKWRWDVFQGTVSKGQFNCHWHSLRERYLGVKPPLLRSEYDFDPGSKYHISANIPYIRYFVSTVLQFQLYRHLCIVAGQYEANSQSRPLHRCDIYRSKEAGRVLKEIMKYGSSLTWNEILYRVTGESKLDAGALREFFRPLEDWLRNENLRKQEYPGWIYDGDYCKQSIETAGLEVRGGFYYNSSENILGNWCLILVSVLFITLFHNNRS